MCRVSCQIAKNGDEQVISNHGTVRHSKGREVGDKGTGSGRVWEVGGSDPPVPPPLKINCMK